MVLHELRVSRKVGAFMTLSTLAKHDFLIRFSGKSVNALFALFRKRPKIRGSMRYALEADEKEFDRLERQSNHPTFDYRAELKDFQVGPGAKIFDAGCGSGIVCRYLAERFPKSQVIGGDFSGTRLDYARRRASNFRNLEFQVENLLSLSFGSGSFDAIVCRYVLQHMDEVSRRQAIAEMTRVLKPGGKIYVIDTDGFMVNLHPTPPDVTEVLKKLSGLRTLDFFVGRKVPALLSGDEMESVRTHAESILVSPETLESEVEMMRERFENARLFFSTLLGSEDAYQNFAEAYLKAMKAPEAVNFYTKFIVQATKVMPKLTLIGV